MKRQIRVNRNHHHCRKTTWRFFETVLLLISIQTLIISLPAYGAGERMLNAIIRSDFIFDRGVSNVPFFPLAWLSTDVQRDLNVSQCQSGTCELDSTAFSQGFGMPVYVGQKDIWILGETVNHDRYEFEDQSYSITTLGGVLAWVSQPTPKWQIGAGVYAYQGIDTSEDIEKDLQSIFAFAGRYRHSPELHSYYALIRWKDFNGVRYYPYLGLDWYPNKQWAVSVVFPWPTVSYAPDTNVVYRFGAVESGNSFQLQRGQDSLSSGFNQWHLGFSIEKRLYENLWGSLSLGTSILDSMYINENGGTELNIDIERAPFIRLSFNYRPE